MGTGGEEKKILDSLELEISGKRKGKEDEIMMMRNPSWWNNAIRNSGWPESFFFNETSPRGSIWNLASSASRASSIIGFASWEKVWIALTWIHLRNCFQSSRQQARAPPTCLCFVNPTHSSRKSMNQPKSSSANHSAVQWNSSDLNIKWLWKGPFLAIADNHRRRGRVRLFNYRARRIVRASV